MSTDDTPDSSIVRFITLGPDSDGRWHVYGQPRPDDVDNPLAVRKQYKIGTVAPEHPDDMPAHVEQLTRQHIRHDYSLATDGGWRHSMSKSGMAVDDLIGAFDRQSDWSIRHTAEEVNDT
jgi:hypothetical protein